MTASETKPKPKPFFSRHIFLFPFKWETPHKDNVRTMDATIDLEKAENAFLGYEVPKESKGDNTWYRPPFQLDRLNHFNEFNYFYDYVSEIIYDLGDDLKADPGQKQLLRHFQHKVPAGMQYEIRVGMTGGQPEKVYLLEIEAVNLNLYETGVGVLSLFMTNRKEEQSGPEDILRINQFGRRIAPPFLGLDPEKIGQTFDFTYDETLAGKGLTAVKGAELAQSIALIGRDGSPLSTDSFSRYIMGRNIQKGPFLLPSFLRYFFRQPDNLITQDADWGREGHAGKIFLKPVLDDRMFVVCWYGGKEKVDGAKQHHAGYSHNYLNPNTYEGSFWYKFLFVDGRSMSTFNMDLARKHLRKHSYTRWAPYSYYGVSRYSLVLLTSSLEELRKPWVNASFLPQHLESIYYKMFELAIVQRASVLRFADEVTQVSGFKQENVQELAEQVTNLYKNYIRFINKVYFREVTAQDQGVEMYDLLQKHMRIETQVEDLDKEIQELHNYVSLQEESETDTKLNAITIVGALLLIPGFLVALYDLPVFENAAKALPPGAWILIFFGQLFLGLSSLRMVGIQFQLPGIRFLNRLRKKRFWLVASILLLASLTIGVYWCGEKLHSFKEKAQEQSSVPSPTPAIIPTAPDSVISHPPDSTPPARRDSLALP